MRQVTATGSTVEEAVQSALAQLETTEDQVEIDVVDEGKRGLFGVFGSRPASVNVKKKPGAVEFAKTFLMDVLEHMGIDAAIETIREDQRNVTFNISGEKMGLLIGKRGQTLNAIQYLTQLAANRQSSHYVRVLLNPENYRERRENTLIHLAERMAAKAKGTKKSVSLEPMPNYERKIIHSILADDEEVTTASKGEEPNRHVVIQPKYTSRT